MKEFTFGGPALTGARCELLGSRSVCPDVLFWGRFLKHLLNGAYKDGNLVIYLSHKKSGYPGCLGSIGDEKPPSYIGILISHYKEPS